MRLEEKMNYQKTFTNVGIYKITSPTNKVYIGQSWVLYHRFIFYKNMVKNQEDDQRKLFNSVAKHGWENHTFEVLMYLKSDTTQEWMDYWEIYFWKYYKDEERCEMLNLREPGSYGRHSEETKAKLRGPVSPELRLKKIAILDKARAEGKTTKGYKHSDESRRKMSEARKGGALAGPNNGMWGKKHSEETRAKLKNRPVKRGPEHHSYGKKMSPETKKRWSEQRKGIPCPEKAKLVTSKPAIQLSLEGEFIKEWPSASAASRELGIPLTTLRGSCVDPNKSAGGFKWKRLEPKMLAGGKGN